MLRVLIFGLALGVFLASLLPLSACALLSSKMAECAEPKAQSPCDKMYPHSSAAQSFKNSTKSCCVTSQAPPPELQFKGVEVGPAVTIVQTENTLTVPNARLYDVVPVAENPSPPSFQSLLCTFLI